MDSGNVDAVFTTLAAGGSAFRTKNRCLLFVFGAMCRLSTPCLRPGPHLEEVIWDANT